MATVISERETIIEFLSQIIGIEVGACAGIGGIVAERIEQGGFDDARGYLASLTTPWGLRAELRRLVPRLGIGKTGFCHQPQEFQAVTDHARGLWAAHPSQVVRIHSLGCATGEEPYGLAMLLLAERELGGGGDFAIVASDIDDLALDHARRGYYTEAAVRPLAPHLRARFLSRLGDRWMIVEEVRRQVRFESRNLVVDGPVGDASADCVVVRNLLSHLRPAAVAVVATRVARSLAPDGRVVLGTEESWRGLGPGFAVERCAQGNRSYRLAPTRIATGTCAVQKGRAEITPRPSITLSA